MIQSLGIKHKYTICNFSIMIKYTMSRDGIHMDTSTNKTLKKYGHKKKLIYGCKLKMKRKLVQIKNRYKLKIKIY